MSELSSSTAENCAAHFKFTALSDALKSGLVPGLTALLETEQGVCAKAAYSRLLIAAYS